jgi:hypothetical protein
MYLKNNLKVKLYIYLSRQNQKKDDESFIILNRNVLKISIYIYLTMAKTTPEKQREYYLKWRASHMEESLLNSKKSKIKSNEWKHICVVFRRILRD